jgi:hypothetical protein
LFFGVQTNMEMAKADYRSYFTSSSMLSAAPAGVKIYLYEIYLYEYQDSFKMSYY